MLTISNPAKARSAGRYYTMLAREDYYTKGGEPPGQWVGSGVEDFGLTGPVTAQAMKRLMGGFGPGPDGRSMVQNAGDPNRRAGWDLTFSAPKSVSVLWSASPAAWREQIEQAHEAAVLGAFGYLENVAAWTRRGHGSLDWEEARFVGALFEHGTSRALDAQLHSHLFVFNVCLRSDGSTGSLTSEEVFRHKMAAGALYRAMLAHELVRRLPIQLERVKSWFEVVGVPASLVEAHSQRRAEVLSALREYGESNAVAAKKAALATRGAKKVAVRQDLFREWEGLALEHGFGPELRPDLSAPRHLPEPGLDPVAAVARLTEQDSHFAERQVVRALAEQAQTGGADIEMIRAAASRAIERQIPLGKDRGESKFTTPEIMELERKLLKQVERGRNAGRHRVPKFIAEGILKGASLSAEQTAAVREITTGRGNLKVVQGLAGTGKSRMLATAREIWQLGGRSVIGVSVAGKAADGLEKSSGIKSLTVDSLLFAFGKRSIKETLTDFKWGKEPWKIPGVFRQGQYRKQFNGRIALHRRSVLVVDEAGMLGTAKLKELLDLAHSAGAKVVLVGDDKQLPAIEAGGVFGSLARRLGASTLKDIRRQEEPWARDMVKDLAEGSVSRGLQALNAHGLVTQVDKPEQARERLVADWAKGGNREGLILAGTNEDVAELNARAQATRKEQGRLAAKGIKVGKETIHAGDRVVFGTNSAKLKLRNGHFGTVVKVRGGLFATIEVRLDGARTQGETVRVPLSRVKLPLRFPFLNYRDVRLGYAVTTHKAQGITVDKAYVLFSDRMQTRELSYVQLSRSREASRLYLTKDQAGSLELTEAARTMTRSAAKEMAHDLKERVSRAQSRSHSSSQSHSL
jgi:conjugative relaxase-like TrwC/TraI family protein